MIKDFKKEKSQTGLFDFTPTSILMDVNKNVIINNNKTSNIDMNENSKIGMSPLRGRGFTMMEVLLGLFIVSLIGLVIFEFQFNIFKIESILNGSLDASYESSKAVKVLAKEIREANIGNDGSFPVLTATDDEFVFFSDINNDGLREKIRYVLSDRYLKKQISKFEGTPPSYTEYGEPKNVINYLVNDIQPVFIYYDSSYDGSSAPLLSPVNILQIRLVKIILEIDKDDAKAPAPIRAETNVMIRNLKDNR